MLVSQERPTHLVYLVMRTEPSASCLFVKNSAHWAPFPSPCKHLNQHSTSVFARDLSLPPFPNRTECTQQAESSSFGNKLIAGVWGGEGTRGREDWLMLPSKSRWSVRWLCTRRRGRHGRNRQEHMSEMAVMQSGLTLADGENKSSLAKRKEGWL